MRIQDWRLLRVLSLFLILCLVNLYTGCGKDKGGGPEGPVTRVTVDETGRATVVTSHEGTARVESNEFGSILVLEAKDTEGNSIPGIEIDYEERKGKALAIFSDPDRKYLDAIFFGDPRNVSHTSKPVHGRASQLLLPTIRVVLLATGAYEASSSGYRLGEGLGGISPFRAEGETTGKEVVLKTLPEISSMMQARVKELTGGAGVLLSFVGAGAITDAAFIGGLTAASEFEKVASPEVVNFLFDYTADLYEETLPEDAVFAVIGFDWTEYLLSSQYAGGYIIQPTWPPEEISATSDLNQVALEWMDTLEYETGYWVERATRAAGPFQAVQHLTVTASYIKVSALDGVDGGVYYYRVVAYNEEADVRWPSSEVTVVKVPEGPRLWVSTDGLDFGTDDTERTFRIKNRGGEVLTWTVSEDETWLQAEGSSGDTRDDGAFEGMGDATIRVTVGRQGLTEGLYQSSVHITSDGGDAKITVFMTVRPEEPRLWVSTDGLDFGTDDTELAFRIENRGRQTLIWSVSEDESWLEARGPSGDTRDDGAFDGAGDAIIRVNVERLGLTEGLYQSSVHITSNGGDVEITVLMRATPPLGTVTTFTLPGGATMEMVWIPSGTFTMGSPRSELGRDPDEGRQHEVTLTRGFWLGKYEITQGQWESVMRTRPWSRKHYMLEEPNYLAGCISYDDGKYETTQEQWESVLRTRPWSGEHYVLEDPNHPAVCISYNEVRYQFVRRLNQVEGTVVYRLPTEAEWEYACRAGTTTRWSFGDDESQPKEYAWYKHNAWDVGERYAHEVGTKLPNPWGLYDMHGNVAEWCQDKHFSYPPGSLVDPTGPVRSNRSNVVIRGGHFYSDAWDVRLTSDRCPVADVRSADRWYNAPGHWYDMLGARLVRQGP